MPPAGASFSSNQTQAQKRARRGAPLSKRALILSEGSPGSKPAHAQVTGLVSSLTILIIKAVSHRRPRPLAPAPRPLELRFQSAVQIPRQASKDRSTRLNRLPSSLV